MGGRHTIGQCATLACLLEATAPKPGNVHRGADFDDVTFTDFVASAVAIAPAIESACHSGVGEAVLQAVRATQATVGTNTNLGTILLLAPLAAVPREIELRAGIADVLGGLKPHDCYAVYEAIRLARPGGLGKVEHLDVSGAPPHDLRTAMREAAERDLVARQYDNGFAEVLNLVVPWLVAGRDRSWSLTTAIIHAQVQLMSQFPDSLIARKCGLAAAQRAADMASRVIAAGQPDDEPYQDALASLDFWLRSDGHRRNPGTTADLIAAGLFAALRDELLQPPYR